MESSEEKEELIWSCSTNSKCVVFAGLIYAGIFVLIVLVAAVILAFNEIWPAFAVLCISTLIIALTIILVSVNRRLRGDLLITNKFLRYRMGRLYFYYSFDELYKVTEYRTLADILGETSSLKIRGLITWSMPDGRITRQAVGYIKLPALYDAKGGKEVLERCMSEIKAARDNSKASAAVQAQPTSGDEGGL